MDDATALRLKKIELGLSIVERNASLEVQLRLALIAVSLTFGTGAVLSGLAGQVAPASAAGAAVAASVSVLAQIRGIRAVGQKLAVADERALKAVDRLISLRGERNDDG